MSGPSYGLWPVTTHARAGLIILGGSLLRRAGLYRSWWRLGQAPNGTIGYMVVLGCAPTGQVRGKGALDAR